jgi:hypothetical protein
MFFVCVVTKMLTGHQKNCASIPGRHKRYISLSKHHLAVGLTQPLNQWVPGTLSPRVQQPGCEADHSPQSSTEAKIEWSSTSTPQYALMSCTRTASSFYYYLLIFIVIFEFMRSLLKVCYHIYLNIR